MLQTRFLCVGFLALAITVGLLHWPSAPGGVAGLGGGNPPARPNALPVGSAAPFDWMKTAAPAAMQVAPMPRQPAAKALPAPITVAVAQKLLVGEMGELSIVLDANAGIGEIGFTVQFDGNALQARAVTEGNWAAGAGVGARFVADISGAEDRVQIHSVVSGRRLAGVPPSVAIVQFQAVAPGISTVLISDVTVKNLEGNPMPVLLSSSNLQVSAESLPPPLPAALRPRGDVPTEVPVAEAVENGD